MGKPLFSRSVAASLRFAATGTEKDLERARNRLRTALAGSVMDSSLRSSLVITLALALRDRGLSTGSRADLNEAAALLESVQDTGAPAFLNLALVLLDLHEHHMESTLDRAVEIAEQAVATAVDKATRAVSEGVLGKALAARCRQAHSPGALDRAVAMLTSACGTLTDDEYAIPLRIELANALVLRFRADPRRTGDLDLAIELDDATMRRLPEDAEPLPVVLQNLGVGLCERWLVTKNPDDLRDAAFLFRRGLAAVKTESQRCGFIGGLGRVLRLRYDAEGNDADLTAALEHLEVAAAVEATEQSEHRLDLALALHDRFARSGDQADVDRAFAMMDDEVRHLDQLDPRRPAVLVDWAGVRLTRYRHGGERAELDTAIDALEQALAAVPPGSPRAVPALSNLGLALLLRYSTDGQYPDLDRATKLLGEVVACTPPGTYESRQQRGNLASAFSLNFLQCGALRYLDDAITIWRSAVKEAPTGSAESAGWQVNLAAGLSGRYAATGDVSDLEAAVEMARHAVAASGDIPTKLGGSLSQLSVVLADRFERTGSPRDLKDALSAAERAVEITPHTSLNRAVTLHNLGRTLGLRYRATSEPEVLERALTLARGAVAATRPGGHGRTTYLSSLGLRHLHRYGLLSDPDDLRQAIGLFGQALEEPPATPLDPGMLLFNLGVAQEEGYRSSQLLADLDQAVSTYTRCLAAMHASSPLRTDVLLALAKALKTRFARTQMLGDLKGAIAALEELWRLLDEVFVATPVTYKIAHEAEWAGTDGLLVDSYLELAVLDPAEAATARQRAFVVAEGRKSRLLAESVSRGEIPPPSGVSPELLQREGVLLKELATIDALALTEIGQTLTSEREGSRAARAKHRATVLQGLKEILTTIASQSPRGAEYAALRRGNRLAWNDLTELSERLSVNTVILSLHLGIDKTVMFVFKAGWQAPVAVVEHVTCAHWEDVRERFLREVVAFDGTGRRGETWLRIPLRLVQQVRTLAGDASRVLLAPDGLAHALPWIAVLRRAGWKVAENGAPALTTVPALGLVRFLGRGRVSSTQALVVGDPSGDLPCARTEARAVAALLGTKPLVGSAASCEVVGARLRTAGTVHLAAHAIFDERSPLDSHIVLSNGVHSARAVLEGRLNADLVTLSACQSGLSGPLAGEELTGLAHAFLYAGARTLLVSLWQVDDTTTEILMLSFYTAWLRTGDRSAALQTAIDEVLAEPAHDHTYFWGAFTLIGAP
ncbi:MAG TPA: CHAT domain-containing protein [Jatrophihabitans sp.]|uniref:CHAT domain-containing protein n=1 Tax=Jatrophihabitans sp. TaxID=1932789 RepID=UPI002F0C8D7F